MYIDKNSNYLQLILAHMGKRAVEKHICKFTIFAPGQYPVDKKGDRFFGDVSKTKLVRVNKGAADARWSLKADKKIFRVADEYPYIDENTTDRHFIKKLLHKAVEYRNLHGTEGDPDHEKAMWKKLGHFMSYKKTITLTVYDRRYLKGKKGQKRQKIVEDEADE